MELGSLQGCMHKTMDKKADVDAHFPDEKDTTAHLPLHAHLRAPESPPPPSWARNSSSCPGFKPTTTSALQVRSANTLSPDPGPSGPMASANGVAASHCACNH